MAQKLENFGIVILAAGQGKRLGCTDLPKVMYKINNQPIIGYILKELEQGGISKEQICLVVGFKAELVKEKFGLAHTSGITNGPVTRKPQTSVEVFKYHFVLGTRNSPQ